MTSSYFSTSLRISKFSDSTLDCAERIARLTGLDSSGMSGGVFISCIRCAILSPLNLTISSSSSER